MELGQFTLDLIINLLASVIYDSVDDKGLGFFERRRIHRRVEDATAEVVEPLLPFLAREKIPEDKQRRLIQTCVDELKPLTKKPEQLFQGSLDGQKIFEELYASRELPQTVLEDDLKDVYTLLCPRIATLLCKIPAAVRDWENEAWSENYKRLDELSVQLRKLFSTVDELVASPALISDETLSIVRRSLAQKVRLELDLTGLRADSPLTGKFENFFVHPEIKEKQIEGVDYSKVIGSKEESLFFFTQPNQQNLLVGPAGAGKSTWVKWLQRETLTTQWDGMSVRVELRRFSKDSLLSVHELIRETAGKHLAEEITAERISHWLKQKQVIFILDGFDEIRPSERDEICDWIIELKLAARECPFIVTSRPLTTDHLERLLTAGLNNWTVEPFDKLRIIDYIQRWYTYTPLLPDDNRTIDADALAANWRKDPTIVPLTGNPLLLSTLLMVHHLDGSLPGGRSQLYRRYVEGMLGLWDDRRQVAATTIQLTLEQKRLIMRGFALKLFFEEQEQIDELDAQKWLEEFLQKTKLLFPTAEILALLRERSGLIIGPGIYSFAHKTIAEFLVAEAVLQGDQRDISGNRVDRFCLFEHRNDDRWNAVTFLWAGLAPTSDVEAFIEECIETMNWELGYGILHDQYDRIPIDSRRELLLRCITSSTHPISTISTHYWLVSKPGSHRGLPIDHDLRIPTFSLRSLGTTQYFNDLVMKATTDRAIIWSDHTNAVGEWKDLLWMLFTGWPNNIVEWRSCLSLPCPPSEEPFAWQHWVADFAFRNALRKETINFRELVATYQDVYVESGWLVPLVLMSTILSFDTHLLAQPNSLLYDNIEALFQILSNSDKEDIEPDWLLGTRSWTTYGGRRRRYEDEGDLLESFIIEAEKFVEEGYIKRNDHYEGTLQYVKELQKRRDFLEETEPIKTPNRRQKPRTKNVPNIPSR